LQLARELSDPSAEALELRNLADALCTLGQTNVAREQL
jgi:hypothetical protein